ncbi:MAG TPA: tlde1 domain-containing protein [Beijerinckiaceae bacterium]|jgi:hypothetical protein
MPRSVFRSRDRALLARPRDRRSLFLRTASFAAFLSFGAVLGASRWVDLHSLRLGIEETPAKGEVALALAGSSEGLLDPMPLSGGEALKFAPATPARSSFRFALSQPPAGVEARSLAEQVRAQPLAPPASQALEVAETPPLPVPRPAELSSSGAPDSSRLAVGQTPRRTKTAAVPAAPADNRSFFEKLLGVPASSEPASSGPALAYAAPESGGTGLSPGIKLSPSPSPAAEHGTAVYDISARVVYMPNGDRLEAHSGLGDKIDDPRFVHVRMRGATPPGTYDLTEREKLFHGVRAIRLNPVGGSAAVHGRAGLLAHTYMLGPNGQSNGCVSFREYDRFLQAYLKGEVKRLVVVSGRGQDGLPDIFRRIGRADIRDRNT